MNKREAQEVSNDIVDTLREIRISKGITQYKLAKNTGMSKSSILYIENHTQHPSLYTILLIADYLDVNVGAIIEKVQKSKD